MAVRGDSTPLSTTEIAAPPRSERPTTAQLKADIDSGRTGDKVPVFDPGLSPLGTDDEAAGHPPSSERIALARESEASGVSPKALAEESDAGNGRRWVMPAFFAVIAVAALVALAALWFR